MLQRHGALPTFDKWGLDTIDKLKRQQKFDVIVLDLMLSTEISGFDVFTEIRTHPELDHVPIVAVSAADPSTALPKAQQMGFDGFISKPIDSDLFPEQLWNIMNGEKVWYTGSFSKNE
jgi:CheY-like chemotaxis protein